MFRNRSSYSLSMLLILSALIITLAGCGGGGGGSDSTGSNIVIDNAQATPYKLPTTDGGLVTIRADVVADQGVILVKALITKPDNSILTVPMALTTDNSYQCQYNAPGNIRTDKEPDTYSVTVQATDTKDKSEVTLPFGFYVPGPETPPDPPNIF
ncbi:MAG: hypothetical protein ACYC27_00885 [Armatimonadota bacterium]